MGEETEEQALKGVRIGVLGRKGSWCLRIGGLRLGREGI